MPELHPLRLETRSDKLTDNRSQKHPLSQFWLLKINLEMVTSILRLLCAGLVLTCGQAINPAFAEKIVVYHVNQATYGAAPVNMVVECFNTFGLTIGLSVDDLIVCYSFVFPV